MRICLCATTKTTLSRNCSCGQAREEEVDPETSGTSSSSSFSFSAGKKTPPPPPSPPLLLLGRLFSLLPPRRLLRPLNLLRRLEGSPNEELKRGGIDGVARRIRERRRGERRSPGGSHVTDRDCRLLRSTPEAPAACQLPLLSSVPVGLRGHVPGVVLGCSQGDPDAELLVAPSSSQASVPPLLRCIPWHVLVPSRSYSMARRQAFHKNHQEVQP